MTLGILVFVLKFCSFCFHRTHWNSTEYQMKHVSRSATACRLHPEIPHPCRSASSVHTLFFLAQSASYSLVDEKMSVSQIHFFQFLFWFIVQLKMLLTHLKSEYFDICANFSQNTLGLDFFFYLYKSFDITCVFYIRHAVFQIIFFF